MSGFTAAHVAMIREQVDKEVGSKTKIVVHDLWIGHVRLSARPSAKCAQIVYDVIDNGKDNEETFGTFQSALKRALELLKE